MDLSIARDGWVHFGDVVMLMNPAPKDQSRKDSAFSVNVSLHTGGTGPTTMTGSSNTEPCARNAFVITRYTVWLLIHLAFFISRVFIVKVMYSNFLIHNE